MLCCCELEFISRRVVSWRMRLRPGLGPARLVWTLQGSWRRAAPGECVAAGASLSAWHTRTHRPRPLPGPTPRLFRNLRCSKEGRHSRALRADAVVSAPVGCGEWVRDRGPGRRGPGGPRGGLTRCLAAGAAWDVRGRRAEGSRTVMRLGGGGGAVEAREGWRMTDSCLGQGDGGAAWGGEGRGGQRQDPTQQTAVGELLWVTQGRV